MTLREKLYDGLDMVAVFSPVSDEVVAALPDALAAHAAEESGTPLRRRPSRGHRWGRRGVSGIGVLARRCVVVHDEVLAPAALALAAHHDGYRGLPMAIHVSGRSLAIMMPHDLFDGSAGWDHMERIMRHVTGAPERDVPPVLTAPVLAALRSSGLLRRRELARARAERRAAESSTTTAPQVAEPLVIDEQRRLEGLRGFWIDAAGRERIKRSLQSGLTPGRPRESFNMRVTGLVLEAVRCAVAPEQDLRVRMNVDLRRYTPADRHVNGPFSTSYPFGTLRTIDTDPTALGAQLATVLGSRAPLWALVANLAGYARGRMRHPGRAAAPSRGRRTFDLGLSILPARLPDMFWAAGEVTNAVVLLHPRQRYDPYVQIAHVRGGLAISLWDETGIVDADAFTSSLRAQLDGLGHALGG